MKLPRFPAVRTRSSISVASPSARHEAPRFFRGGPGADRSGARKAASRRRHAAALDSSRDALQRVRRREKDPPDPVPGSGADVYGAAGGAIQAGCALEFIHTYSLIHDDLPALDNDDLRRGKPTCHKVFGEAMAILAGDALLTLAFSNAGRRPLEPARRVRVIAEIAAAAGTVNGMVGGQVADVEAGGKPVDCGDARIHPPLEDGGADSRLDRRGRDCRGRAAGGRRALARFGENIGWAFQVVDDILDVEESSAALGKTAGKDQAQQKATYPALYGLEKSRAIAADLEAKALKELDRYGGRGARLRQLAEFLVARRS